MYGLIQYINSLSVYGRGFSQVSFRTLNSLGLLTLLLNLCLASR